MSSYELTDPQVKFIKGLLSWAHMKGDKKEQGMVERIEAALSKPSKKAVQPKVKAEKEKELHLEPKYAAMMHRLAAENGRATAYRLDTTFDEAIKLVAMGYMSLMYSVGTPDFILTEKGTAWLAQHPQEPIVQTNGYQI